MTEAQFTRFQIVMAVIETFVRAGCLTALYVPFVAQNHLLASKRGSHLLPLRGNHTLKKCVWIYGGYVAMSFIGMLSSSFGLLGVAGVIFILWGMAPTLKIDRNFAVFLAIIYFCMDRACGLIGNSVLYLLNKRFASGRDMNIALRHTAYHYICVDILQIVLLILMVHFVSRKALHSSLNLNIRELCYLAIVPVIGIVFGEIVVRLLFVVKDHVIFEIYDQYPAFLFFIPLIAVLFCMGIFLSIISYRKMIKLQEEKKRYFVQEQQIHAMQKRIEEVELFFEGIQKMRHEMRNHLTNIKGLVEHKNYEDIQLYISKMDDGLDTFELSIKTGNPVLDVIVNDKYRLAKKQGINFWSDFYFPASDSYNAYDVGIIVNNLLVNAIEACEKMKGDDKYIWLSGKQKRKFYMIEVKNSYEGEVQFDHSTNLPISTKPKGDFTHGIGLSNVREEALKYMGDVDIQVKSGEFYVTVLLQEHTND